MSILANIQILCKKNNTSVPKLEKELGFGNGSIYNWDKNSPSTDKLQKVSDHFKVPIDYLLFGFNRSLLAHILNLIRSGRSLSQFSRDTGVDEDELQDLCSGSSIVPPSLEIIEKIAANNPITNFIDRVLILKDAGYDPEKVPSPAIIKDDSNKSEEAISIFDDIKVRAMARRSFSKDPSKEALLKKIITSMLEED